MPREFKRTDRVGQAIARELAVMISKGDVSDPRISPVSIAGVTVTRDFAHAKIYFSVFEDSQAVEAGKGLNQASGYLRCLLAQKLSLRTMPKLHFEYDDTLSRARKLDKIINGLCIPAVEDQSDDKES